MANLSAFEAGVFISNLSYQLGGWVRYAVGFQDSALRKR